MDLIIYKEFNVRIVIVRALIHFVKLLTFTIDLN